MPSGEQGRHHSEPAVSHYLRYPSERITFSDNCLGTQRSRLAAAAEPINIVHHSTATPVNYEGRVCLVDMEAASAAAAVGGWQLSGLLARLAARSSVGSHVA